MLRSSAERERRYETSGGFEGIVSRVCSMGAILALSRVEGSAIYEFKV